MRHDNDDRRAVHQFDHHGVSIDQHARHVEHPARHVNYDDHEPDDLNFGRVYHYAFHHGGAFDDCARCRGLRAVQRGVL